MTLKSALLAGVAICGMAAAPALARDLPPSIHFLSVGAKQVGVTKTRAINPSLTNFTQTATFTTTLSTAAAYHVPTVILADTWYDTQNCTQPTKERWVGLPKKTKYAIVNTGTQTGTIAGCGGTFTMYTIKYKLAAKHAIGKSDTVAGDLIAKNFIGYNLKLVATIDLTIAS